MKTVTPGLSITRLPFQPAPGSSNSSFRIDRYCGDPHYLKDELLVPHRKDYYFLVYVRSGNGRHWVDTSAYRVNPGMVYLTNPQQVLMKEETGKMDVFAISFTPLFLALDPQMQRLSCIVNKQGIHEIALEPAEITFIDQLMETIEREFLDNKPMQQQMLQACMKTLLVAVSRAYSRVYGDDEPSEERSFVCRFLTTVDHNFSSLHEVAQYASLMNVSPGYLGELVKGKTGRSPINLIHQRIVLEAKRLLFHTEQSVKEISFALGFEDDSYFVRFFKRQTGSTPAAYRSSNREMYH